MKKQINQRDAEGRHHGLWEDYYSNGTLRRKAHWHHGKNHGLWEWYRSDGTLWWRTQWHHGVRKGLDKAYDRQSRIIDKCYHLVIR